ncbi:hypothetical protein HPC49_29290 [Pyxidicoccus fallax]|uniref:Lipoprotein n=1 Tax=Pyxidicoccus fallax TaxID=394095 RepID=A0A848LV41_9BACT|nr:hypothetical protein [Pyxidicoccus fallax]NMO21204.1 hypothetical protein [Pyxidicoccus fallax]NPC82301.1 hypothetical protein [Pyxidicoccus fallax]
MARAERVLRDGVGATVRGVALAGLVVVLSACGHGNAARKAGGQDGAAAEAPATPDQALVQETVDRRTPRLSWVFDDRLGLLSASEIGIVREGDTVTLTVDTRQRFSGSVRTTGSEAELNGQLFFPTTTSAGGLPRVSIPPSLAHFYVSLNGARPFMLPRECASDETLAEPPADALACQADVERSRSLAFRHSAEYPTVYVCPPGPGAVLIPSGADSAQWSLFRWDLGQRAFVCVRSWEVVADRAADVDAVTLVVTTDGTPREIGAVNNNGVWRLSTTLAEGFTSLELRVKYENGQLNQRGLGAFEVTTVNDHSLIRVQPELLTTRSFRAVNLAIAVTPVSERFFDKGPWQDGFLLNGLSPSLVVRFSGENATLVQFGLAASLFLNRAMSINGGLLFGSSDPNRPWDPVKNLFIGVALDPVLMTELGLGGTGDKKKGE